MDKKTYPANVEIIRQGQDGTKMYIVEKGEVNVSKVRKFVLAISRVDFVDKFSVNILIVNKCGD